MASYQALSSDCLLAALAFLRKLGFEDKTVFSLSCQTDFLLLRLCSLSKAQVYETRLSKCFEKSRVESGFACFQLSLKDLSTSMSLMKDMQSVDLDFGQTCLVVRGRRILGEDEAAKSASVKYFGVTRTRQDEQLAKLLYQIQFSKCDFFSLLGGMMQESRAAHVLLSVGRSDQGPELKAVLEGQNQIQLSTCDFRLIVQPGKMARYQAHYSRPKFGKFLDMINKKGQASLEIREGSLTIVTRQAKFSTAFTVSQSTG